MIGPPSANSIVKTNLTDIQESRYLLFIAQDVDIRSQDWVKRLIETCDSLPDFGMGGVECCGLNGEEVGRFLTGHSNNPACEVTTCDGAFIVIPSYLFLERQFSEEFPWYPCFQDYGCWLYFDMHLKTYHVPVKEYYNPDRFVPTRWVSKFKTSQEFSDDMKIAHQKMLKKWNLECLPTTSFDAGKPMRKKNGKDS